MATAATPPPNKAQQEYVHRVAWKASVMGTLNVLVAVIAVRAVLLVAVAGAVGLAAVAIRAPDPFKLGVLAIYGALVVLPSIWLSSRR